jgi:hypothetical protein
VAGHEAIEGISETGKWLALPPAHHTVRHWREAGFLLGIERNGRTEEQS